MEQYVLKCAVCNTFTGELKALKVHLITCPKRQVSCKRCLTQFEYQHTQDHVTTECKRRFVACTFCTKILSVDELVKHHLTECPRVLVDCPNKCDEKKQWKRNEIQQHLDNTCPFHKLVCMCGDSVMRKDTDSHLQATENNFKHWKAMWQCFQDGGTFLHQQNGAIHHNNDDYTDGHHHGLYCVGARMWTSKTISDNVQVNDIVDALDPDHGWYLAQIIGLGEEEGKKVRVHFLGYNTTCDKSLPWNHLAPAFYWVSKRYLPPKSITLYNRPVFDRMKHCVSLVPCATATTTASSSSSNDFLQLEWCKEHQGGWSCCGAPGRTDSCACPSVSNRNNSKKRKQQS
jgi:hypothetical protein